MVSAPVVGVDEHLRAIACRIDETLASLEGLWRRVSEGRPADVLGVRDIPWLIRQASGGGKMIRPQMVHWGWVSAGAPSDASAYVVDLGAAVECLHLFALIHDDIMDRSELRRGQPTVHAVARQAFEDAAGTGDAGRFGDAIAILAGDLVQAEASRLVAGLPEPVREAWRTMIVELVLGQRRDLTGAALGRRDLDHALEVARLKSGAYTVAGPLRMGALLGGATPELRGALDRYAWHVGEAFGLRDDLLGTWGDPRETGKSSEDDLTGGKATVLLAQAGERLSPAGRDLLSRVGDLSATDVDRLRLEMAECGVRDEVERMIADEVALACRELDPALVAPEGIAGLTDIARRIAWRTS